MPNKTIYVRDAQLWAKARELAGPDGLSDVIHTLLTDWVQRQKAELDRTREMVEIALPLGGDEYEEEHGASDAGELVFVGRLLADTEGWSVSQSPRLRIFQTESGKLVVYRSWDDSDPDSANYRVYQNYEALARTPLALSTMWIAGDPEEDESADQTEELELAVRKALGQPAVVRIG